MGDQNVFIFSSVIDFYFIIVYSNPVPYFHIRYMSIIIGMVLVTLIYHIDLQG